MARGDLKWQAFRAKSAARRAARAVATAPPIVREGGAIVLGRNKQTSVPVLLSERARLEHAHFIGTTGGGKSRAMEACIRQDILHGRGVCVIDPHGSHPESLYASLLGWLSKQGYTRSGVHPRTVHVIDPNAPGYSVGFNPLALPTRATDVAVVAKAALQAFERVWGDEDTQEKPTLRRVLLTTFITLAELGLTLAEADLLYEPDDPYGIRAWACAIVAHPFAKQQLARLDRLASDRALRQSFEVEVLGPINRLTEFLASEPIRAIVGQTERAIDLCAALDEGHIILANLSGGELVDEQSADMLGRLLTRYLLFHTKRRRNLDRSCFIYLDECHRYLSGDLPTLLAEARKYRVGLVLAHQFLAQFGKADDPLLSALRSCTNLKAVFRLRDNKDAQDLAEMAVPLDLEMPVKPLIQPKVVGHRIRRFASESDSEQESITESQSRTDAESVAVTDSYLESLSETFAEGKSSVSSEGTSLADGVSHSLSSGSASGTSTAQFMTPAEGFFDIPAVLGVSEGTSSLTHAAEGKSSSLTKGRTSAQATGKNSMHATMSGSAWGESTARSNSVGHTKGTATTKGSGRTRGSQDGLEPIMADLPSAVHSKENVLYMAAQTLRNLTTGTAFINFVDTSGMKAALVAMPDVRSYAPPLDEFDRLRVHFLKESPSALPAPEARRNVSERKAALIASAGQAGFSAEVEVEITTAVAVEPSDPEELGTGKAFRVKKKRDLKPKR